MVENQPCPRCKRLVPSSHFIGVRGNTVKHCAGCRKQTPVVVPPLENYTPAPAGSPSLRRSRSPSFTASPSGRVARNRIDVTSAASVVALETRLSSLEQSLNGKIGELLAAQPLPSASLPPSQAPQASQALPSLQALPPPPRPQPPPAVVPVLTSAGPPSITAGESALLSITRCFAWVPLEVVAQVE